MRLVVYIDFFDGEKWTSRELAMREVESYDEYCVAMRGILDLGFRRSKHAVQEPGPEGLPLCSPP